MGDKPPRLPSERRPRAKARGPRPPARPRILLYCESQFGVGHYVRSLAVAQAFQARGWDVGLVSGGTALPGLNRPPGLRWFHLPPFIAGAPGTILASAHEPIGAREFRQRVRLLQNSIRRFQPDWFVTEHFPFGRTGMFDFYDQVLEWLAPARRAGKLKIAASVRDVISWEKYSRAHLEGLFLYIRKRFDLVLVHSDPRMIPWSDVISRPNRELPQAFYTGFVAEAATPLRGGDQELLAWLSRQRRSKFTILASAGGGREGYRHLKFTLEACRRARGAESIALLVVCGPNLPGAERAELLALAAGRRNIRVVASVPALKPFFHACDLSISHAGYNTAVHLLSAGCQSILVPMPREFVEQNLRARRLRKFNGAQVIPSRLLSEKKLGAAIQAARRAPRRTWPEPAVDGADVSVALVELFNRHLP